MLFFDANAEIGRSLNSRTIVNHEHFTMNEYTKCAESSDNLIEFMDDYGIDKAVIWCRAMYDLSPDDGNLQMIKELENHKDRLYGSWTILPSITDKAYNIEILFENMLKHGIRFLRAFPFQNRYLLNEVTMGKQLKAMEDYKVPLYLSIQNGFEYIYDVLREFPKLTVIICDTGCWSSSRYIYPLIHRYKNVYYETGGFQEVLGYEKACKELGSERLLFGTDFSSNSMGCAKAALLMANISDEEKENIASNNIMRVIKEIRL